MLGFKKIRRGRERKILFLGQQIYSYTHPPSEKELADKSLQKALEKRFQAEVGQPVAMDKANGPLISLTTYGERANKVHITLQSLFEQSCKPAKILLWLDRDEFSKENLPEPIRQARERGVEIGFCENLRSYKKIIPTLYAYASNRIITVDDDIMYPPEFVAGLDAEHQRYPNHIVAYRAHVISFDEHGKLSPYRAWKKCIHNVEPSLLWFPTGAGGVLYPPNCFDPEVLDQEMFMDLCPTADDIWLKAMSLRQHRKCHVVPGDHAWSDLPPFIANTQEECLAMENVDTGNDTQLRRVFDYYDLWSLLR